MLEGLDITGIPRQEIIRRAAADAEAAAWIAWVKANARSAPAKALAILDGLSRRPALRREIGSLFRIVEAAAPADYHAYRTLHQKVQPESVGRAFDAARREGRGWPFARRFAEATTADGDRTHFAAIVRALARGGADARRLAAAALAATTPEPHDDDLMQTLERLIMDPLAEVWGWAAAGWGFWAARNTGARERLDRALGERSSDVPISATASMAVAPPDERTQAVQGATASNADEFIDFDEPAPKSATPKSARTSRSPVMRRALAALGAYAIVRPDAPIRLGDAPPRAAREAFDELLRAKDADPYDQASAVLGLLAAPDVLPWCATLAEICRRGVDPVLANLAFVLSERRPSGARAAVIAVVEAIVRESPDGVPPEHIFGAVRARDALIGCGDGGPEDDGPELPDIELECYLAHRARLWRGAAPRRPRYGDVAGMGELRALALAECLEVGRDLARLDEAAAAAEASCDVPSIEDRWRIAVRALLPGVADPELSDVQDAFTETTHRLIEDVTAAVETGKATKEQRRLMARRLWLVQKIVRTGYRIDAKDVASSRRERALATEPTGIFITMFGWLKRALESGVASHHIPLMRAAADSIAARPAFASAFLRAAKPLFAASWSLGEERHRVPLRRELVRLISGAMDAGAPVTSPPADPTPESIESLLTHPIFDEKLLKSISARTLDPRARAEFEKAARMRSVGYGHSRAADAAPADGPDPMDRPGWIDGTFEIVRRLGRGGFGVVYECASTNFGVVAVKVFLGASSANTPHHARFTEAINMAQIAHASIPRLVAIGDHRGYPYIAIELIDGVNLRAWAAASTIGFDERRQILLDIAEVLHYAHARGVTHRDLKPENVMVTREGRIKVLDWGMAYAADIMKAGGRIAGGTMLYAAPEQWTTGRESADPKVDLFAYGRMAIELLATRPLADLVAWGSDENPSHFTSESLETAGVPKPLIDEVLALTALDPRRRTKSMERFLALLHEV